MVTILQYGQRFTGSRRCRIITGCAVGLVIVCCAVVASRWRAISEQLRILRVQQRCLDYTLPKGTVVYEERKSEADALAAASDGYQVLSLYASELWSQVDGGGPPIALGCHAFPQLLPCSEIDPREVAIFCHERTSPSGNRRIVVVGNPRPGHFWLPTHVVTPAGFFVKPKLMRPTAGPPSEVVYDVMKRPRDSSGKRLPLRIQAGEIDTTDAAHFTLCYTLGGASGVIDGWLTDTDRVRLKVRDGPCALPPPMVDSIERTLNGYDWSR